MSVLNLTSEPRENGRSAASVRAAREKKRLEDAWETSNTKKEIDSGDSSPSRKQAVWLDRGRRGGKEGLLRQTILEEDDTSEDGF